MPQRRRLRPLDPGGPDHRLLAVDDVGALDGARLVMDAGGGEAMLVVGRIKNVALDEEMLERAGDGLPGDAVHRRVADARARGGGAVRVVAEGLEGGRES